MNRRRRTRAQIEQLEQQILTVLAADHPQSVRHVFYRMTDPRLPEPVEKTERGYAQVQQRITALRRAGRLDYGWITDATRRGYHVNTFASGGDFVSQMAGLYRADLWRNAACYIEVWCESRSIAGVIEDDCRDLAVSLYPAGGFSSVTLIHQAAGYINQATNYGEKPAHVVYVGDHDPAGVLIDKSIDADLRHHLHDDVELSFHRLAITETQIAELDLPIKPRKAGDKRALHITETVEAEAMPANILRSMLREAVEAFMPDGALSAAKVAEESERQGLRRWAEIMGDYRAEEAERYLYE